MAFELVVQTHQFYLEFVLVGLCNRSEADIVSVKRDGLVAALYRDDVDCPAQLSHPAEQHVK